MLLPAVGIAPRMDAGKHVVCSRRAARLNATEADEYRKVPRRLRFWRWKTCATYFMLNP